MFDEASEVHNIMTFLKSWIENGILETNWNIDKR